MGHFVKGEFTYIQKKKKKTTQNQSPGKKSAPGMFNMFIVKG